MWKRAKLFSLLRLSIVSNNSTTKINHFVEILPNIAIILRIFAITKHLTWINSMRMKV